MWEHIDSINNCLLYIHVSTNCSPGNITGSEALHLKTVSVYSDLMSSLLIRDNSHLSFPLLHVLSSQDLKLDCNAKPNHWRLLVPGGKRNCRKLIHIWGVWKISFDFSRAIRETVTNKGRTKKLQKEIHNTDNALHYGVLSLQVRLNHLS